MAPTKSLAPSKTLSNLEPSAAITLLTSSNNANAYLFSPAPLHLTRRQDLLDVELAPVDISIYDPADTASTLDNA